MHGRGYARRDPVLRLAECLGFPPHSFHTGRDSCPDKRGSEVVVRNAGRRRDSLAEFIHEAMATKSQALIAHALIAAASRYYSVGRLAGFQAEQILIKDIPPVAIPIRSLSRFSYVINMDSARQLSTYPPLSVLRYAEVVNGKPAVTPLAQPREKLPTSR